MMSLLLLALLPAVLAQTDIGGTIGVNAAISAGVSTRITYTLGPRVVITASGTGTLNVNVALAATASFVAGYTNIGTAAATIGFDISVTASGGGVAVQSLVLESPDITAAASLFTSGSVAGCLVYSATASAVVRVPAQQVAGTPPRIVATLPNLATGTYVFVSVTETVPLAYETDRAVYAEGNQTFTFASPTELSVMFRAKQSGVLRVGRAATTTVGTADARTKAGISLGVYLTFTLGGAAATNENHDSEIRYTYSDAQCTAVGISSAMQSNLRLAFYNSVTASWEFPASGGRCDVTSKTVIQATNHFSEWAIYHRNGAASVTSSFALVLGMAILAMLFH
jgi:hypothetical protein